MHGIRKKEITDISDIDWNGIIKKIRDRRPKKNEPGQYYWDKRAASFVDHAGKTAYPDAFLKIMEPRSDWTVIDMGCGGGTLALPLAARVKKITAVDYSDRMLEMLGSEAQRRGINNINTIKAGWDDDWAEMNIGLHDVAIASRSLSVDDVHGAIMKLKNVARKRVYISTIVGDGPYDRRIFDAIGRELIPSVDYIYVYNLLYEMGIHAGISFIPEESARIFDDFGSAGDYFKWMLNEMTLEEEYNLDQYLRKNMIIKGGKSVIEYKKSFKWAVIWWDQEVRG
ncbi:MAG: methyltransferase domain-containing protein [Deltaproteobacteria bacterium]|nr:methyltransferase domain-containing protein [Deltaproteobacteria bacterium]